MSKETKSWQNIDSRYFVVSDCRSPLTLAFCSSVEGLLRNTPEGTEAIDLGAPQTLTETWRARTS